MKTFHPVSFNNVALIGGAILASLAFAAEPKFAKPDAEFITMDANKDGKVSADEHAGASRKMLYTMDANRDGKVTAAELDVAHKRVTGKKARQLDLAAAEKIKVVDTDSDGILTADEHAAGSRLMFEKMDIEKDGFLSKTEFVAGHASMLKKPAS